MDHLKGPCRDRVRSGIEFGFQSCHGIGGRFLGSSRAKHPLIDFLELFVGFNHLHQNTLCSVGFGLKRWT